MELLFWIPFYAAVGAAFLVPLALIALGMSFIVSVEPWVAALVVLAGWPIAAKMINDDQKWRKSDLALYGIGAAWVIGALALVDVIGPALQLVILIPAASVFMYWGLSRLEIF